MPTTGDYDILSAEQFSGWWLECTVKLRNSEWNVMFLIHFIQRLYLTSLRNYNAILMHLTCLNSHVFDSTLRNTTGNGIIDENEFLQWVARIQALRDDPTTQMLTTEEDEITQDLIAAFRWTLSCTFPFLLERLCNFSIPSSRVFDRDGNGYITRDELQSAMEVIQENVTEIQVSEMLELADLDKDGKINYEGMQNCVHPTSIAQLPIM